MNAPTRTNSRRRGSAYVFVLGASLLIATAGILATTLQSSRVKRQLEIQKSSIADNEHAAAIETALALFHTDPAGNAWRSFRRLTVLADAQLGTADASHTFSLTDPADTDLESVKLSDQVKLQIDSVVGAARRSTSFTVTPVEVPSPTLSYALIARSRSGTKTPSILGTSTTPTVLPTLDASFSSTAVAGTAYAKAVEVFSAMNASPASGAYLPSASLFTYYLSIGTRINLASNTTFDKVVFSPTSNPAGTGLNAKGVYVIDCNNKNFILRDSRVYGTIVLIDVSTTCEIGPTVSMSPASPDMPTLLVDGSVKIRLQSNDLSESTLSRNFNPTGAPYLGGTDSDTTDVYPCIISGISYISGKVTISDPSAFEGTLFLADDLKVDDDLSIRWAPTSANIPGFTTATQFRIDPASVRRVAP